MTRDAGASRIEEAGREALGFEGGTVATVHAPAARIGWIDWAGAVGLLVSFFTSSDYGETAESPIACAEDAELELWWSQILALLMPILSGHAVLATCPPG